MGASRAFCRDAKTHAATTLFILPPFTVDANDVLRLVFLAGNSIRPGHDFGWVETWLALHHGSQQPFCLPTCLYDVTRDRKSLNSLSLALFSRLPISFSLARTRDSRRTRACSATCSPDSILASPSSVSLWRSMSRCRWCSIAYSRLQTLAVSTALPDSSGSSEEKPNAAEGACASGMAAHSPQAVLAGVPGRDLQLT